MQQGTQLKLRVPEEVRTYLARRARSNLRSVNAEVNVILQAQMKAERQTAGEPVETAPTA